MALFLQFTINGIMIGSIYALLAVGIVLIYKSSKIFNFSAGELSMFGAFFLWTFLSSMKLPLVLSLIFTMLAVGIVAYLMERFAIHPLIGQPLLSILLVTLGLSHMLEGLAMFMWGGYAENLPQFLPGKPVIIGDIIIANDLLWAFGISISLLIVLLLFFKYTRVGLAMRAVAEDHQTAQARGINVSMIFGITWFIAGSIASIGGMLLAYRLGVSQFLADISLKAFPVVLIGGLESVVGAFIGGIIVGVIENLAGGFIAPWLIDVTPYVILILVLFVRPEGLFGLKRIERI